jgi:hypothetical protein
MSAIGPIAATEHCYPVFLEGQVLTHNDLNLLRDFLYSKWAFHNGAMFGFGVACGLDAVATTTDLTFETGFALAQSGRALELTAEFAIKWGDIQAVSSPAAFGVDFVTTTSRGGMTAVLVPNDEQKPISEECDPQTGCRAHTIEWCEGAQIVFVNGELKADAFLAGPVFKLEPIEPTTKQEVKPEDFKKLRDSLAELLKGAKVEQATIDLLTKIQLKTGEPGLNLMKVGVLNEILYTLWEYERCRAYDDGDCRVATGLPAVALGWLDPSAKAWDCHFRHHFRLSTALYRAIQGYRCDDLCDEYLDRIRVLVQNFDPPKVPPSSDPPTKNPPKPDICKLKAYYSGNCHWTKPNRKIPGRFVAVDPTRFIKKRDPGDPPPDERLRFTTQPWDVAEVYGTFDPTDSGIVHLTDYLGFEGEASKAQIQGGIPGEVRVVPSDDFATIDGLERALVGAGSDAIYLGVDSRGAVVATGVVATAQTLQQVPGIGATAAEAKTSSAQALQQAGQAIATAGTAAQDATTAKAGLDLVQQGFGNFRNELAGKFEGLRGEWTDFRRTIPRVDTLTQAGQLVETFGTFRQRFEEMATKFEGIRANVDDHKQLLDNATAKVEALGQAQTAISQNVAGLRSDVDGQKQVIGQTASAVTKLDDQQAGLGRQLEEAKGELTASIQSAHDEVGAQKEILARVEQSQAAAAQDLKTETRTLRDRVDRVVAPPRPLPFPGGPALPNPLVPNAIVNALDAMRGAVETATPTARAARVQARLAEAEPHLEALRAEAELGGSLAAEQPAALAHAIDALREAVAAAGLDKRSREYRRLSRSVNELREALGAPAGSSAR